MTDGVIMITSSRIRAGRRSGRRVSARCASGLGESKVTASTARNERMAHCASREGVATESSRMAAGRRAAQGLAPQHPAARQMGAAAGPDPVDAVEDGWLVRHRTRRDDDLGGLVESDEGRRGLRGGGSARRPWRRGGPRPGVRPPWNRGGRAREKRQWGIGGLRAKPRRAHRTALWAGRDKSGPARPT